MRRRHVSTLAPAMITEENWRDLSPMDALRLVMAGKLEQDLYEDFFQLKPIELEKLIWLIRIS